MVEITVKEALEGSVYKVHGALPIPKKNEGVEAKEVVEAELLMHYDAAKKEASLVLDPKMPTVIQGKEVIKYTMARVSEVPHPEVGNKIYFGNFFINIKK